MKNTVLIAFAVLFLLLLPIHGEEPKMPAASPPATPSGVSGPTKEQTIEFIKRRAIGGYTIDVKEDSSGRLSKYTETTDLMIHGCRLVVKEAFSITFMPKKVGQAWAGQGEERVYEIPLNRVERIGRRGQFGQGFEFICAEEVIVATQKPLEEFRFSEMVSGPYGSPFSAKRTSRLSVIVWVRVEDVKEVERLAKAFNHLRKLCGAPDPLSFD